MSERTERKTGNGDPSKVVGAHRNASGRDEDASHANGRPNKRTAGKDRDLDKSGESKNQAHGHPREERGQRDS